MKHGTTPSQGSVMEAIVAGRPSTSEDNLQPSNLSSRRFPGKLAILASSAVLGGRAVPEINAEDRSCLLNRTAD